MSGEVRGGEVPCHFCDDAGGFGIDGNGWPVSRACECCGAVAPEWYIRRRRRELDERNRGFHHERTEGQIGAREAAFARVWASNNRGKPGLNHGRTALQNLMTLYPPGGGEPVMQEVTARDYRVAATVFQFLGTNGGRSILWEVTRELKNNGLSEALT